MPGARRMDRNSREYIRGTAQRPGKRGQIELVYVREQWAPPVSCEQDNDDGAARKRERPRRKFLDVPRADIQEVKYGNQWFAVWSEEKLKCNLSALLTLAVLHSSLKCISYSVIHMHAHAHTRAHTELQCKAATGATSAFGLHVFSMQSSWGSKHQSTTIQKPIHRRLALSLGLSMRWNMHGERCVSGEK